jgi:hypothetical protein
MLRTLFFTFALLFVAPEAFAGDDCYESQLVFDDYVQFDLVGGVQAEIPLPTWRMGKLHDTRALAILHSRPGSPYVEVEFTQLADPGEVGLDYNVYKIAMTVSDADPSDLHLARDYTAGCTRPGLGFFPGQTVNGGSFKINAHPDGSPRTYEFVHMRIWGHL